jgi:hypothetical protein
LSSSGSPELMLSPSLLSSRKDKDRGEEEEGCECCEVGVLIWLRWKCGGFMPRKARVSGDLDGKEYEVEANEVRDTGPD